ncbi:MAG: hypothetical protein AB7O47_08975 [Flavobacteriales bacterium]
MYKWIIAYLMFFSLSVKAQSTGDFKTLDSLSYYLYINAKWQELSELKPSKEIDYHYLNLRIGIAFYELKKYHRAEKYLLKAYQQNKSSEIAASYLYSASIQTGNLFLTAETHEIAIGDSIKFTKALATINLNAGMKLSANKDAAGNINLFSVGLGHIPSKKMSLYQSFTFQNQQNNIWGDFTQLQYYFGGSIKLTNKWSVDISSHLNFYKSNIDFKYDTTKTTATQPKFSGDFKTDSIYSKNHLIKGNYSQQGGFLYLGLTKTSGALKFSPFIEFNTEKSTSNITETTWTEIKIRKMNPTPPPIEFITNQDSTSKPLEYPDNLNQLLIGSSIQYTLPFAKENFTVGLNFYQTLNGINNTIISPFAKIKFKKSILFVSYLQKNNIAIAENYASYLQNSYDNIHHQINVQFSKPLSLKTSLNLFYQFEDKTDALSLIRFKSNMLSLSLFFKL